MRNEALEGFGFLFLLWFLYAGGISVKKIFKNMFVMNHFNGTERFKILFKKTIGNSNFNGAAILIFCFISFILHEWQYELFFVMYAVRSCVVSGDTFEEMAEVIRHKEKPQGKQVKPYSDFEN